MKEEQLDTEDWKELRRRRSERGLTNMQASIALLREHGISFTEKNCGYQLVITHGSTVIDFWPTTGTWIDRSERGVRHIGVFRLLTRLGVTVS